MRSCWLSDAFLFISHIQHILLFLTGREMIQSMTKSQTRFSVSLVSSFWIITRFYTSMHTRLVSRSGRERTIFQLKYTRTDSTEISCTEDKINQSNYPITPYYFVPCEICCKIQKMITWRKDVRNIINQVHRLKPFCSNLNITSSHTIVNL